MPVLYIIIVIVIGYWAITAISTAIAQWSGESRRRLARSYEAGYALAPSGSKPGDVIERDPLVISRDPIMLPAWREDDEVVRVTAVKGVAADRRQRGWWWTGTSFQVVAAGRLAFQAIASLRSDGEIPPGEAASTVDPKVLADVTYGDEWRRGIASQIRTATEAIVHDIVIRELAPRDGIELTEEEVTALNAEFQRRMESWGPAVEVVRTAALAVALVDELSADVVDELTRDWRRWLGLEDRPPGQRATGIHRIAAWSSVLRREAARHPALTAVWTTMAFTPGLAIEPTVTVVLYGLLVAVAAGVVLGRHVRRIRRVRHRTWAPRGDVEHAKPSVALLRRLMTVSVTGRSFIAARRLDMLLEEADVWVALEGPTPDDASRTLRWISKSGQPAPILLGSVGGGSFALAFTDPERHVRTPVTWTARCRFSDLARYLRGAGIQAVVLDPGCEPSVEIVLGAYETAEEQPPTDE